MRKLKIGMVQQSCTAHIPENMARLQEHIREAAAQGAQLVVLQELHNSLYFCQEENAKLCDLAEPIPGPSTESYGKLAKELGIVLVLSLFERRTAGIYHNTAVVLEADGSIAGTYRKMHIPDDPLFYEKFYFTPGDLGFRPIKTSVGTLGVLVCWDQWYPEAARAMALNGAELLIYPTAIGGVPGLGAGAAAPGLAAGPARPQRGQWLAGNYGEPYGRGAGSHRPLYRNRLLGAFFCYGCARGTPYRVREGRRRRARR